MAVINVSVCGVIEMVRMYLDYINKIYVGYNGIIGVFIEDLIDISQEFFVIIVVFRYILGGVFGFCCYKLCSFEENQCEYECLV